MHSSIPSMFALALRIIYDYEIIYITDGTARFTIAGTEYICKKGDIILLRPGVEHIIESIDDYGFTQPHIHFDLIYNEKKSEITPVCFKNRSDMSDGELELISEDILDKEIPYVFTPLDAEAFERVFFAAISAYQKKPNGYELTLKSLMLQILTLVAGQFESASVTSERSAQDPIVMVKNYIDNNYLQPITLDGLQMQFYINKYTLIRNFKRVYQKSPIAYYRELRLEYAKMLLRETARSVASIASELNFPDIYSFSRFFREAAKLSPSEYRSQIH